MLNNELDRKSKIKYLLLNKVINLSWNYYELDLNAALHENSIYVNIQKCQAFLDQIRLNENGKYEYYGDNNDSVRILRIMFTLIDNNREILPSIIKSLFKNNEIINDSESDEDQLGKLNLKERKKRDKLFKEKIRSGFRAEEGSIVVLAEGDSWFQFPKVYVKDPVCDIIDWLIEDPKYAVKSLAAGGDWLSNILYTGEYIEELPKIVPHVFLISGGGNDLVGNNRLALMVKSPEMEGVNDLEEDVVFARLLDKRKMSPNIDLIKYKRGLKFVSKEFIKFMNIYFVQYFVFLHNICHHEKYKKMLILTQGYDYAIPYNKSRANWMSFQWIINHYTDTGHWLFEPLNMKGIVNKEDQESVIYTLIHEFNEMLIQLAEFKGLKNVFHIDCRGLAKEDDWFDELHLKSGLFKKITNTYKYCITQNIGLPHDEPRKKVYKVTNPKEGENDDQMSTGDRSPRV